MRERLYLIIILLLSSVVCNAQYEYLLHKTYAQRHLDIDSLFYYNWDLRSTDVEFNQTINKLEKLAIDAGDRELQYEAKLLRAAHNSADQHGDTSLVEPIIRDIIAGAQKYKLIQIEIRARQFRSTYLNEKRKRNVEAMMELIKSYHLMHQIPTADFPTKKEHIYNVAHAYYNFGDYRSAKLFLLEAIKVNLPGIEPEYFDKNKISTVGINIQNTLGLVYKDSKQYDSAIYYFTKAIDIAKTVNNIQWVAVASGNIGGCYYLQGMYDKAIPYMEYDIEHSINYTNSDGKHDDLYSIILLANIYRKRGDLNTTKLLLDSARKYIDRVNEPIKHLHEWSTIMTKYYADIGDLTSAYKYSDTIRYTKRVLDERKDALALLNIQRLLNTQIHEAELEKKEQEKRAIESERNMIIVFVLVAFILVMIIVNRQLTIYKQKTKLSDAEKSNALQKLKEITKTVVEKNKLIDSFSDEINIYKERISNFDISEKNNVILKLQESVLLTDEQWEEFKENFDKLYPNFFINLRKKLPELTPAEIRFMTLTKLNMSNKEMANMLGIGASGVRNYKSRVRKKLNITDDNELDKLINSL